MEFKKKYTPVCCEFSVFTGGVFCSGDSEFLKDNIGFDIFVAL